MQEVGGLTQLNTSVGLANTDIMSHTVLIEEDKIVSINIIIYQISVDVPWCFILVYTYIK
jgi:hypothetical protein